MVSRVIFQETHNPNYNLEMADFQQKANDNATQEALQASQAAVSPAGILTGLPDAQHFDNKDDMEMSRLYRQTNPIGIDKKDWGTAMNSITLNNPYTISAVMRLGHIWTEGTTEQKERAAQAFGYGPNAIPKYANLLLKSHREKASASLTESMGINGDPLVTATDRASRGYWGQESTARIKNKDARAQEQKGPNNRFLSILQS